MNTTNIRINYNLNFNIQLEIDLDFSYNLLEELEMPPFFFSIIFR